MDMTIDPPPCSRADSSIDQAHALTYWNSVSSDINGMLGGFPQTLAGLFAPQEGQDAARGSMWVLTLSIIVLILMIRPQGLFAAKVRR